MNGPHILKMTVYVNVTSQLNDDTLSSAQRNVTEVYRRVLRHSALWWEVLGVVDHHPCLWYPRLYSYWFIVEIYSLCKK